MPYSDHVFDPMLEALLRAWRPASIVDVGVGAGKTGQLVRRALGPEVHLVGVEAHAPYLEQFAAEYRAYDEVVRADFYSVVLHDERAADVFVFGDVLEHFPWSRALDCLDYAVQRAQRVLAVSPLGYAQGAHGGVASERHLSELRLADVAARFVVEQYHRAPMRGYEQQLYVLRGAR